MVNNITFKLVSPSKDLLNTDIPMVIVPGDNGDMGIMAGHSPVISTLRAGEVILRDGDVDVRWFIEGGFVEVTADKVVVLAEHAIAMVDVTKESAEADFNDAEAILTNIDLSSPSAVARAKLSVEIAKAKMSALSSPAYS